MHHDRLIVGLLFLAVTSQVLKWREGPPSLFDGILARLRHECDPDNPEADYYWSQRSMPTERKRAAIIEDCREIGAELLPEVRQQLAHENDPEVRGMLVVIAGALGDEMAVESVGRVMVWSDFPAVRICAAQVLRRLHDRRSVEWFRSALQDPHFVVNGGCGTLRELFYPVRGIAQIALRELDVEPVDADEIYRRKRDEIEKMAAEIVRREREKEALSHTAK